MATALFRNTTYAVSGLVQEIERGDLALPDIQRPFVWKPSKVRDLFDSMYRGFPVGYLLLWETGAEVGARQIGSGQAPPKMLIVDGQQRLTSLYAVLTGATVLNENYESERIRLAFRPDDGTFAVADAAVEQDAAYIPDISVLWNQGGRRNVERQFLDRLQSRRGEALGDAEADRLAEAIDRLHGLKEHYTFESVVLLPEVAEDQVADVFVRINSEGENLNQADFILTLMSVFWEKGRRELEDFARRSRLPSLSDASPFNWYLQPQPAQLLRVGVALGFRRARLQYVYPLLRGKDLNTKKVDPQRREEQFQKLEEAQQQVLDLTNWHEYLACLERAGFRSSKMISSQNAVLFTYVLWLIGRVDYRVPLDRLREVIARWFFMAQLTMRYTGSFESRVEQDMVRIHKVDSGESYCNLLSKIVEDRLTNDYWTITLPNELETSASKSPALLAYMASLNVLDAQPLLSRGRVRALFDPAVLARKRLERHHLFPRSFLQTHLGVRDTSQVNQIANMAFTEWSDNIRISDRGPAEYWTQELERKRFTTEELARQRYWHALPEGWESMAYVDFLAVRRKLLASVIRDAFERLSDSDYRPEYPPVTSGDGRSSAPRRRRVGVSDLLDAGLLVPGNALINDEDGADVTAIVLEDGRIEVADDVHETPSGAAKAAEGRGGINGWTYWSADTADGLQSLDSLREKLRDDDT